MSWTSAMMPLELAVRKAQAIKEANKTSSGNTRFMISSGDIFSSTVTGYEVFSPIWLNTHSRESQGMMQSDSQQNSSGKQILSPLTVVMDNGSWYPTLLTKQSGGEDIEKVTIIELAWIKGKLEIIYQADFEKVKIMVIGREDELIYIVIIFDTLTEVRIAYAPDGSKMGNIGNKTSVVQGVNQDAS
jgi:hypothetical protein